MRKPHGLPEGGGLLELVTASLDDGKALDVTVIDLKDKSELADYMVIASGASHRHVAAMSAHLTAKMKAAKIPGVTAEGAAAGDWVLIDGGDVIVHLFRPEVRAYYDLEKIWSAPPAAAADRTVQIGGA